MLHEKSIARTEDDDINEEDAKKTMQTEKLLTTGYHSDERSGDDVTDSDKEFEQIVELDKLVKSFQETSMDVQELHTKINDFFSKLRDLTELIDFESADIKEIVEGIVAKELIYFPSFPQVVKLAETAYFIQLPYLSFWKGLQNLVLVNFHEMELNHVI